MARNANDEQGFILIGAIWLLILCGSIAAVLTMRAVNGARAVDTAEQELKDALLLDAALETVLADILINGPRSKWALLPAAGTVEGLSASVSVQVTSELGRLDVNEADPELIARAFQGFGIDAQQRAAILGRLALRRAAKKPIGSWAELNLVLGPSNASPPAGPCLAQYLTLFSGRPIPDEANMPPRLAGALSSAANLDQAPRSQVAAGTPLRIELSLASGAALTVFVRLTGLLREPYTTMAFDRVRLCA